MQAENSRPASGRWTTRDILTFVVFNLVIVFLTMAAKMIEDMLLAPQNTFFVGSWLFPPCSRCRSTSRWRTASESAGCWPRRSWCSASSTRSWEGSTALRLPSSAPSLESSSCRARAPTTTSSASSAATSSTG